MLAYGRVLRDLYLLSGRRCRAWTWHEAADHARFPTSSPRRKASLVWIGNWGDDERSEELHEFLIEPVKATAPEARVYGVRYPEQAQGKRLAEAGSNTRAGCPTSKCPQVFADYRLTVHVPAAALCRKPCLASRPSASSKPWPVASRWSARPGTTREPLYAGPGYLVARNGKK